MKRDLDLTSGDPPADPADHGVDARRSIAPDLDVRWIHGHPASQPDVDPPIQVHAVDADTFVLRQSMAISHEAPFLYLLCGSERALLLDTGATADPERFPLRATVDAILAGRTGADPGTGYELVVAHSHGHADHVAADGQFADRAATTIVPAEVDAIRAFFGIASWPDQVVPFDLGGRMLEITGCPGHHAASIAVYDPWTGFLLTGDTVYPGRLYVGDMDAFIGSLGRLVALADRRHVSHVMGGHIEMTTRLGRDYPLGAVYQPDEPPLQMPADQLRAVRDAARSISGRRGVHVFNDFIIFDRPGVREFLPFIGRSLRHRLGRRLSSRRRRS